LLDETAPATPTADLPSGPLTFFHNRTLNTTRSVVAGSLRVAFVGDSMTYGAGLQYKESLAPRVGVHLNGALPEVWVECLSFGLPGACAYNAVGRVITHALPLEPGIVVLCLCCNDAIMLAGQPDTAEGIGRTWIDYEPILRTTLRTFRDVAAAGHARAAVLFHDRYSEFGGVSMTDAVGRICEDLNLPFIDGPSAVKSYQHKDLMVSVADGHVNALGNDAIARLVAQFILGRQWTPASKGYADGNWIEGIEATAHARAERGSLPALAFAEALSVLETKWIHRRNTGRRQLEPRYAAARERLLKAQRTAFLQLSEEACGRHMRTEYPLRSWTWAESLTNEAMAASFAFEHAAVSDASDRVLEHLVHLTSPEPETEPDPGASRAKWESVRTSAAQVRQAVTYGGGDTNHLDHHSPDRDFLTFWRSRVAHWCYTVERCAERYVDVLARIPESRVAALAGPFAYSDFRAREIEKALTRLRPAADRLVAAHRGAERLADAGSLTLELVISAPSGPALWWVNVGLESYVPAFSETHIGCFNIIRDGEPHIYKLDIPLMLAGDIRVHVHGGGLSVEGSAMKVYSSSRLVWRNGDLAPVSLPPITVEGVAPECVALVCRSVHVIPVAN